MAIRILLVDDHALFLEGMKSFLDGNGFCVVGTARNAAEAQLRYEMLKPDLVLMDLQMAECDGIEATRLLKRDFPAATIIMLSACEEEASLFQAMQAGATGYLVKGMEPQKFLDELKKWSEGEVPLAPGMAARMLKLFSAARPAVPPAQPQLTERQLEILRLVAQGNLYKQIALQLEIKETTVKYHVKEIMAKLYLANRSELISFAIQRGLL